MLTKTRILCGLLILAMAGLLVACGGVGGDARCADFKAKINGCFPGSMAEGDVCNPTVLTYNDEIMDMSCDQLSDKGKAEWVWPWQSCSDLGKCWEDVGGLSLSCRPRRTLNMDERKECGEYLGSDFIDSDKLYNPELYKDDPEDPNGANCEYNVRICDTYELKCIFMKTSAGEFYRCRKPESSSTNPNPIQEPTKSGSLKVSNVECDQGAADNCSTKVGSGYKCEHAFNTELGRSDLFCVKRD